ncbi:MAG: chloride channel protein [Acidimicrobiales bacterium]
MAGALPGSVDTAGGEVRRAGSWAATLTLAAITGAVTGAGVTAYELVTDRMLYERVLELPPVLQAILPAVGLAVALVVLRTIARGASPATADDYIRVFHRRDEQMDPMPVPGRMLAGIATLGSGGALGFEGPSLYLGAAIGSAFQGRFGRFFRRADAKTLMVAGAAAGVAAIFKTPATGAVFALEVPYQDDTAHGHLLPALTGAAVGYLVQVAVVGTAPLFPVSGTPPFDLRELGGALLLGLLCGLGARGFSWMVRQAKFLGQDHHPAVRVGLAGATLAALGGISWWLFGNMLALGTGYQVIERLGDPDMTVGLLAVLLVLRTLATGATLTGGGVGGLFIPLAVSGALVGRLIGVGLGLDTTTTLFAVVGVAAFLGAGYRTPLAGVMFVAEATGQPGFVVPGLLAAVASQLVMGDASVSLYQHTRRMGHLERRFSMAIASVIDAEVWTVPADSTLDEFLDSMLLSRQTVVPVVEDGNRYVGIARVDLLGAIPRDEWDRHAVGEVADVELPTARPDWTIREAVEAMERADTDVLAVVDDDRRYIGVVSIDEIVRLDEILARRDRPE